MTHEAVYIVDEFLQHPNTQARRNAAIALGVIGDRDAIQRLLRLALGDADAEVRGAAEAEIAALCRQASPAAREGLSQAFEDPARQEALYALMGRLHAHGATAPEVGPSVPWLRLAFSLFGRAYPNHGWRFRVFRAFLPGVIAAFVGLLGALAYLSVLAEVATFGEPRDLVPQLTLGLFAAAGLLCLGSLRASAFGFHPRPGAGALAEIGWACAYAAIPTGLVVLVMLVVALGSRDAMDAESWLLLAMTALLPLAAGTTRAGTLLATGLVQGRTPASIAATAVGAAAGLAFVTAVAATFRAFKADTVSEMWVLLIPTCFGLAGAFAWIDAAGPAHPRRATDRRRAAASLAVVGVMAAAAAFAIFRSYDWQFRIAPQEDLKLAAPGEATERTLSMLPARFELTAEARRMVTIHLNTASADQSLPLLPPWSEAELYLGAHPAPKLRWVSLNNATAIEPGRHALFVLGGPGYQARLKPATALGLFLGALRGDPQGQAAAALAGQAAGAGAKLAIQVVPDPEPAPAEASPPPAPVRAK